LLMMNVIRVALLFKHEAYANQAEHRPRVWCRCLWRRFGGIRYCPLGRLESYLRMRSVAERLRGGAPAATKREGFFHRVGRSVGISHLNGTVHDIRTVSAHLNRYVGHAPSLSQRSSLPPGPGALLDLISSQRQRLFRHGQSTLGDVPTGTKRDAWRQQAESAQRLLTRDREKETPPAPAHRSTRAANRDVRRGNWAAAQLLGRIQCGRPSAPKLRVDPRTICPVSSMMTRNRRLP
jgi:hypothetical protein